MEKTDSYLLMMVGLLVVALMAVELVPMPMLAAPGQPTGIHASGTPYRAPNLGNGAIASVLVIPTSTLATVSVS